MALPFEQFPLAAGVLLAFSLAAPPGPANALIASVAARRSFAAGWVTGIGAVAGDVLMFTLMWLGVLRVVDSYPWARVVMGAAGAGLMLFFAWEAARTARRIARRHKMPDAPDEGRDVTARGGFARSFVAVTTSPFNWGWWLTVGTALFARLGWGIVAGFFVGLVAWCALWSALARAGTTRIPRFGEAIAIGSAIVLVVFAIIVGAYAVELASSLVGA